MTDSVARITSPNFYLGDLQSELESLTATPKTTAAARRGLEHVIRDTLAVAPQQWPTEPAGRAALILWILDHPKSVSEIRFRHRHEKYFPPDSKPKKSAQSLRRGGY